MSTSFTIGTVVGKRSRLFRALDTLMSDPRAQSGVLLMNRPGLQNSNSGRLLTPRRLALPWVLWIFGLSTTLLLVGLWGRAVTIDKDTIAHSTEAALSADLVTDRVWDWIGEGLSAADGVSSVDADRVLDEVRDRPGALGAVDALVEQVVEALVASPGTETTIDVASALAPLVPEVVSGLAAQGVVVPAESVEAAVDALYPVALDTGEAISVGVVTEQARELLTLGVLAAAGMLVLFGSIAIALSDDRWAMVRNLATRIAFSAASFGVFFRFGGWVLDPDGGGSPLRRSGAILVSSNLHVFVVVGAAAASIAAAIWVLRRPRSTGPNPPVTHEEIPSDTSTQELISV